MQQLVTDFFKIEKFLSSPRLQGYKTKFAKRQHPDPIALYKWNLALSESLYPLLHVIEVALRNAIYEAVARNFHDRDWLLSGNFLADSEAVQIRKEAMLLQRNNRLDPGHLIAELNFGFWTALLDRRYEHKQILWPTLLRGVFPCLQNRKIHVIRRRFSKIRKLRNRIYHYEPIWHWKDLSLQHDEVIEAIGWIEPELLRLVDIDRFYEVYNHGLPIAKKLPQERREVCPELE